MKSSLGDIWYKLKCKYWHKYNTVICKQIPPTWVDRDHLIEQAMFQVLTDFLEKEDPFRYHIKFTHSEKDRDEEWVRAMEAQSNMFLRLIAIYNWYWDIYVPHCNDSVKAHDRIKNTTCILMHQGNECVEDQENILSFKCQYCNSYWDSHHSYEEELDKTKLEKMKELVELSPNMWT